MPGYGSVSGLVGAQQPNMLFVPDAVQRHAAGMIADMVDPAFGMGRFIYLKASAFMNPGDFVTVDSSFTATLLPVQPNTGQAVYVSKAPTDVNMWGWFQMQGMCSVYITAATPGPGIGIGSAAGAGGPLSAGKQILGAQVLVADNQTLFTRQMSLAPSGARCDTTGLSFGMSLAGTGLPANTVVNRFTSDGQGILLNNPPTIVGGSLVTVGTGQFPILWIQNPHVQGQIT